MKRVWSLLWSQRHPHPGIQLGLDLPSMPGLGKDCLFLIVTEIEKGIVFLCLHDTDETFFVINLITRE